MIGFYNYSVIVTYLGVAASLIGIALSCEGRFDAAIFCLALAGACDACDGKIARAMKNRTQEMEIFGVQIDSLCDMVCFGVTPAILCYQMGMNQPWGVACAIFFVLCGAIRLAYFNMMEEKKHLNPDKAEKQKYYHGLPITTITIIFPFVYMFKNLFVKQLGDDRFPILLAAMLIIVGFLYILNFRLKKPNNLQLGLLMLLVAAIFLNIFVFKLF